MRTELQRLKLYLLLLERGETTRAHREIRKDVDLLSQRKFEKKLLRRTFQGGLVNPR